MSRILYGIKQSLIQINRNKAMSLASVLAITAMMLILGLFFVISVNINLFTEMVKQDYNKIEIYLDDNTTQEESNGLMEQIRGHDNVKKVEYRSKDDAIKILKKRWGDNAYLLDSLEKNPLPNSILIEVDSLEGASEVTKYASNLKGVEDVKFYQETVDKLTKITDFIQTAALVIMAFLVVVSIVVVSNTIKLTVLARSKEISIMKYVGATNWFIRGPFLFEGILIGIFASLISGIITYLVYGRIIDIIGTQVMTILSSPLVPAGYLAINLLIIFVAMGVSIGACGSIISMRKFLDK